MSDARDELLELGYTVEGRTVSFTLDEQLHPRDAIYDAAYSFVDRCHVLLTCPAPGSIAVHLRQRHGADRLEGLARDFGARLLDDSLRSAIAVATGALRDYCVARALVSEAPRADIDAILAELDAEDPGEDPLEIRLPWDDKRRKEEQG